MLQWLYNASCSRPTTLPGREFRRVVNKIRAFIARRYDPVVKTRVGSREFLVHASNANPVNYSQGTHEQSALSRMVGFVRKLRGDSIGIVDIGANVGFTAFAAYEAAPDASFLLLEGDPRSFVLLKANTQPIPRRTVVQAIVGESDEKIEGEFLQASGTASFVRHGTTAVSERAQKWQPPKNTHRKATLDTLIAESGLDRVDYLKIDTDGAEALIIAGATHTLTHHRPVVLCEFNPLGMVNNGFETDPLRLSRLFQECGYTLYAFFDSEGRLIVRSEYGDGIQDDLARYCMSAYKVFDMAVFHNSMRTEFDAYVEAERQDAAHLIDAYLGKYGWRA